MSICTLWLVSLLCAEVHVRGTIQTSQSVTELIVELRSAAGQATDILSAVPSLTGQFDIANVKPGQYILAVKLSDGQVLKEEHIYANGHTTDLNIRLGEDQRERVLSSGERTVSARRLNHKVPKAAQKAMARYRKCRQKRGGGAG